MFGSKLQQLLACNGITISRFARELGLPKSTVSEWIGRGDRFPSSPESLRKISNYFELSIHELLFDEPDPFSVIEHQGDLAEITNCLGALRLKIGKYKIEIKKDFKKE